MGAELDLFSQNEQSMTLYALNKMIKDELHSSFPRTYWVTAEISDFKEQRYSGHCYLELVQKQEDTDNIFAKARAVIWANKYKYIKPYFLRETGMSLAKGQQILANVKIEFHENYGMSLVIQDIDPAYTLGNILKRRTLIVKKLKEDGVYSMNKELEWPEQPQKIAIISSNQAAGFGDFVHQLNHNSEGIVFYAVLFQAIMQGENSPKSVIKALNEVLESNIDFDLVVIIRGGGASADLSCFDNYDLCFYAAQFPIPILAGLGHERDVSILDEIANRSVKTPTAAAEYIVNQMYEISKKLEFLCKKFIDEVEEILQNQKENLSDIPSKIRNTIREKISTEQLTIERFINNFNQATSSIFRENERKIQNIQSELKNKVDLQIKGNENQIRNIENRLSNNVNQKINNYYNILSNNNYKIHLRFQNIIEKNKIDIENKEKTLRTLSPDNILARGFSIVYDDSGKLVRDAKDVEIGSELFLKLKKGSLKSKVIQKDESK